MILNKKQMRNKQFTALYQIFYGIIGALYNLYLLLLVLNANKGTQAALAFCFFILFSSFVFFAGLSRYNFWRGNLLFSLVAQGMQIANITLSELHLNLRCGTSINIKYEKGIFTTNLDIADIASALTWKMAPDINYGINVFAILICVLLFVERPKNKLTAI